MDYFAGLDISMDETHVCVLDREGMVVHESKTASTAQALADELAKAPSCRRIVFETRRMAPILFHGLRELTRSALAEWQKKRGFAPTSFLDSAQLAALRADSETEYQKYLAAQPAPQPAAAEAPRRALAKPSPKPPVVRAAKPPAPAAPARRVVKRTNPNRPETADQAAPPPPPPIFLGGSPAWRRRAGLPELPTDPGLGGRPPGFWTGSSGGLLLGGVRHY
jgi:hypothetical protein